MIELYWIQTGLGDSLKKTNVGFLFPWHMVCAFSILCDSKILTACCTETQMLDSRDHRNITVMLFKMITPDTSKGSYSVSIKPGSELCQSRAVSYSGQMAPPHLQEIYYWDTYKSLNIYHKQYRKNRKHAKYMLLSEEETYQLQTHVQMCRKILFLSSAPNTISCFHHALVCNSATC